jgi:transcriptional regulator with XRE-family HTH domain
MTRRAFGDLLKEYRTRGNLSQWALSTRAGVARSYLQRLEAGQQHPGRDVVEALADAMTLDGYERALLAVRAGYVPLTDPAFGEMVATIARYWAARQLPDDDLPTK